MLISASPKDARGQPSSVIQQRSTPAAETIDSGNASGLYVRIDPNHTPKTAEFTHALSKPFVDGAAIMIQWASLEPKPGAYNWSLVDPWLAKVVSLHKKLSIGLMAGWLTPQWLYAQGVPINSFNFNRNPQGVHINPLNYGGGPEGEAECTVLTLPSPWHPVFVREFNRTMRDLAQHLREYQPPGATRGAGYDALRIVKISGINNTTEELRLDATRPDNGPCHQSDARAIWAAAGFRPNLIATAWTNIADSTADSYPGKLLSIDVIASAAFPWIDDNGGFYTPAPRSVDSLSSRIIDIGIARWGHRFSVQWDALSQAPPDPAVIDAGSRGATIGWQLNEFLGPAGGTGCIYGQSRTACRSAADFQSILDNGIALGGKFIEIWAPNVDEFAANFQNAHLRLATGTAN
jgi:hypothetical protein